MARAGSTSAPRAQTSAHAGSQYSAPRASITPPQGLRSAGNSTALYHGRKNLEQSSTTRQLFQSSPPQTRVFKPLIAPNSPVAAAPESELLHTIARKKAEIAAATAAATQELAALEKAAGISPIQTNQIIQPAQTINIAAALQRQTTEQAAARPPTHPNKQEPAQIPSPLTPDKVLALPQATNATNANSKPEPLHKVKGDQTTGHHPSATQTPLERARAL